MLDHLIKPISYVFGVFVTFIVVICIYLVKLDYDVQTYCNTAVQEFVDKARATGYISANSYRELTQKFGNTGNLYTITIKHESYNTYPVTDDAGNVVSGQYSDSYRAYYNDEILEAIFPEDINQPEGQWSMKTGDYLKVSFELQEATLGSKLYRLWTKTELKTISGSYGGYVGGTSEVE